MLSEEVKIVNQCRLCDCHNIQTILDFGKTALANSYVTTEQSRLIKSGLASEFKTNLSYFLCKDCGSVQIHEEVNPEILFDNYLYASSTSGDLVDHFKKYCEDVIERFSLNESNFVVVVGSNDGVELKNFVEKGIHCVGVEPAFNLSLLANQNGYPTRNEFFNEKSAQRICNIHGRADIIMANNCLAHTDLKEFIKGVEILLKENGTLVFENSYLLNVILDNLLDTYYTEHVFQHSFLPLKKFFRKHGFKIFDWQLTKPHGGSFRCFVKWHSGNQEIKDSVYNQEAIEKSLRLNEPHIHDRFLNKITDLKERFRERLVGWQQEGLTISAFGYPAKATTLCKFFGMGNIFEYVVENSNAKIGYCTPGYHIPIVDKEYFDKNPTDICIVLAWNYYDLIVKNNPNYKGKWVNPLKV